jgi:hemoglobin
MATMTTDHHDVPEKRIRSAAERRMDMRREAAAIGIDEDYISVLVDTFYGRIRQHQRMGPMFDEVIGDHWPAHLAKLKQFWSSVALGTGVYDGKPVPAHLKLHSACPGDFKTWLKIFAETLHDTAPTPQAAAFFLERANRIASSLQMAMFGAAVLPGGRPMPARVAGAASRHTVLEVPDFSR